MLRDYFLTIKTLKLDQLLSLREGKGEGENVTFWKELRMNEFEY